MSAEEVLREWLRHAKGCDFDSGCGAVECERVTHQPTACSCGLDAALASLVPAVGPGEVET